MRPIIVLSSKGNHSELIEEIKKGVSREVIFLNNEEDLNFDNLLKINPEWIFVPHWNNIIKKSIWKNWKTVIFHMTDLPYGRGGSPLQNLIKRKHSYSFLSSFECSEGIDDGPIYLKTKFSLKGKASQIFRRVDKIIIKQIIKLSKTEVKKSPQKGKKYIFKRRTPSQSNLSECEPGNLNDWYDHIRMLDCEGYPKAYIEFNGMRIIFDNAKISANELTAKIKMIPNKNI